MERKSFKILTLSLPRLSPKENNPLYIAVLWEKQARMAVNDNSFLGLIAILGKEEVLTGLALI